LLNSWWFHQRRNVVDTSQEAGRYTGRYCEIMHNLQRRAGECAGATVPGAELR